MGSVLQFFLLTVIGIHNTVAQESQYTLASSNGLLEFEPYDWNLENSLIATFKFETRSHAGRLLTLVGKDVLTSPDFPLDAFELTVKLNRGTIEINFKNDQTKEVVKTNFQTNVADGISHTLRVEIDAQNYNLIAFLDEVDEVSNSFANAPLQYQQLQVTAFYGGYNDLSMLGCVDVLSIETGENANVALEVSQQDGVTAGCQNPCRAIQCQNQGICLNFYDRAECDCYDTGFEGLTCSEESASVKLSPEQYIKYTLPPTTEQHPDRITFSFKPETDSGDTQVLFYTTLKSDKGGYEGELIITMSGNTVQFHMTDKIDVRFTELDLYDGWWHSFLLKIDYQATQMELQVDLQNKSPSWSMDSETEGRLIFDDSMFFGGSLSQSYGISLNGCLKDIYVQYRSIIGAGKQNHPAVSSNDAINYDGCDGDDVVVVEPTSTAAPTTTLTEETETESPRPVTCDLECQNGGSCFIDIKTNIPKCICGFSGFSGPLCQFSTLTTNCDEAFHLGDTESGVYIVDLDGKGPLKRTFVDCVMLKDEKLGLTILPHNMPNNSNVRSAKKFGDSVLPIKYRLVCKSGIKALVKSSAACRQFVQYDCVHAPLQFDSKTWFKSASYYKTFGKIGQKEEQCPCADTKTCAEVGMRSTTCNCDADQSNLQTDQGWLLGQYAGVTSVTVLQYSSQDWGKLTLGPLMCSGSSGEDKPITFRRQDATVEAPGWRGDFLKIWFRTTSDQGLILHQKCSNSKFLETWLRNGHMVEYIFNFGLDATTIRVVSQRRLNDSNWHRLLVEHKDQYVRFSLDQENEYYELKSGETLDSFDGVLNIGGQMGQYTGFLGCVRQLEVDNDLVDLHDIVMNKNPVGIEVGCPDHCSDNPCANEAICVENFDKNRYECICKNPWAHSGRNCENDVNRDSEVSFHNPDQAYIKYLDLYDSPLDNTMVFSFRTDQSSALLIYALDQFYNFMQVHLSDDNQLSLTLNYDHVVYRCSVTANREDGDFNDMKWHQVVIQFASNDYTSLQVDHLMCAINGTHTLSQGYISRWDSGGHFVTVVPPRPPVPPKDIQLIPYTILYVGGVPKPKSNRVKRQSDSFFYTELPPLMGCIRGFKIADSIVDLRNSGERSKSDDIKLGCDTGCEQISCEHGGSCHVAWQSLHPAASCSCIKTSYFGPTCGEDRGLHFDGSVTLTFDMKEQRSKLYIPSRRPPDTFYFSFSTDNSGRKQYLVYIGMDQDISFDLTLEQNGYLLVVLNVPGEEPLSRTFYGNYTDGTRHFVFMKFKGAKTEITVDGMMNALDTELTQPSMSNAQAVVFGGWETIENRKKRQTDENEYPEDTPTPEEESSIFRGCISNVVIDFHLGDRYRFTPFDYYEDVAHKSNNLLKTSPPDVQLPAGICAEFVAGGILVPKPPKIVFPPWNEPFKREAYVPGSGGGTGEDEGSGIGIIIGIVVVLILVILIVLCFVCLVKKKKKGEEPPSKHYNRNDDDNTFPTPVKTGIPPPKPTRSDQTEATPDENERLVDDDLPPPPLSPPNDPGTPPADGHPPYGYKPHGGVPVLPHRGPPGLDNMPSNVELPEGTENLDPEDQELTYQPNLQSPQAIDDGRSAESIASGDSYHTAREPPDDFKFPPPPSEEEIASMTPGPTTVTFRPKTNSQFVYPDIDKPTRTAKSYPASLGHTNSFKAKPPVPRKPLFVPTPTTPPEEILE